MASGPADERAGMSEEEVRRVIDALAAIEEIADEEQRVKAKSQIMAAQVGRNKAWAQERTLLIRRLAREEGLSYRQIAARLEIKLGVVQDAFRNYTDSGTYRGRGGGRQEEQSDG
jgi:DNA-directed RNA polymerase specialized sigma24 family protein